MMLTRITFTIAMLNLLQGNEAIKLLSQAGEDEVVVETDTAVVEEVADTTATDAVADDTVVETEAATAMDLIEIYEE